MTLLGDLKSDDDGAFLHRLVQLDGDAFGTACVWIFDDAFRESKPRAFRADGGGNSRILIATHCEDNDIINKNMKEFIDRYGEENLTPDMHPLIRSHKACYKSTKKAIEIASSTGANLHVLHLSTADEVELFKPFACTRLEDRKITAEVCAHHMFFNNSRHRPCATYCRREIPTVLQGSIRYPSYPVLFISCS